MSADDTYDEQVALLTKPAYDVWVDFNSVSETGETGTLLKFATRPVRAGAAVLAGDAEGNLCRGEVTAIVGEYVALNLYMYTFVPTASPWTSEMLAAIADANEAYEDGIDCE